MKAKLLHFGQVMGRLQTFVFLIHLLGTESRTAEPDYGHSHWALMDSLYHRYNVAEMISLPGVPLAMLVASLLSLSLPGKIYNGLSLP